MSAEESNRFIAAHSNDLIPWQNWIDTASVRFVPLETKTECLMGGLKQIQVTDSFIFVVTAKRKGQVMMFDRNGKFLRKIGRYGKGPGEHIYVENNEYAYKFELFQHLAVNDAGVFLCYARKNRQKIMMLGNVHEGLKTVDQLPDLKEDSNPVIVFYKYVVK